MAGMDMNTLTKCLWSASQMRLPVSKPWLIAANRRWVGPGVLGVTLAGPCLLCAHVKAIATAVCSMALLAGRLAGQLCWCHCSFMGLNIVDFHVQAISPMRRPLCTNWVSRAGQGKGMMHRPCLAPARSVTLLLTWALGLPPPPSFPWRHRRALGLASDGCADPHVLVHLVCALTRLSRQVFWSSRPASGSHLVAPFRLQHTLLDDGSQHSSGFAAPTAAGARRQQLHAAPEGHSKYGAVHRHQPQATAADLAVAAVPRTCSMGLLRAAVEHLPSLSNLELLRLTRCLVQWMYGRKSRHHQHHAVKSPRHDRRRRGGRHGGMQSRRAGSCRLAAQYLEYCQQRIVGSCGQGAPCDATTAKLLHASKAL